MLNGLPVVNYGPKVVRQVVEAVDKPIIALSGTPFPRLTSEVAIAAGFTAYLGAGISYPCSYIKSMKLEDGHQELSVSGPSLLGTMLSRGF